MRRHRSSILAVLSSLAATMSLIVTPAAAQAGPSESGVRNAMGYYLALGDSLAAGYQPGVGDDRDGGYVGGVLTAIRQEDSKTRLANVACSGETAVTLVTGGRCDYREGSQLAAALAFLHRHGQHTRVVTIDIGANDVARCVTVSGVDLGCVENGLADVARILPGVLAQLKAAAPNAQIVVLDYYNPFLAAWLTGPSGQQLARVSTGLQTALSGIVSGAAAANHVTLAPIAEAFRSADWTPVPLPGVGQAPTNVAMICSLTWMCAKNDIHANDAGYALMATTVAAVMD